MRRALHISVLTALTLLTAPPAFSQDLRLANGVILKGAVVKATEAGLEIQGAAGTKTYSWETLSTATRYRYQPVFRANYEMVLQGLPPSARTNVPEVDKASAPAEAPKPEAQAAPQATTPAASLKLFDQAQYENVEGILVGRFPNLQLRAPDLASYLGLQYGPGRSDVLYLGFDTKGKEDPRDMLFVYSPGYAAYSNTIKVAGFKKSSGDTRIATFKKFKIASRFGVVSADYDIECTASGLQTNVVILNVSALLSKGDTKNRFVLNGEISDVVQGEGVINIKGLMDLPVLWIGLDLISGTPRLVGNLNMSHLKLVPKEGVDNRVTLVVSKDSGEEVQREAIKLDESTFEQKYGIVCDVKKPMAGQTYRVKASIDLGPFLGVASCEEKFTIPGIPGK